MARNKSSNKPLCGLWKYADDSTRARLTQLRAAVEPILANNILHHFTDHSVTHSDSVCGLIDSLIECLQVHEDGGALSEAELTVLYSACYLHDIGMQYENAGETRVIRHLQLLTPWEDLDESLRRDSLRQHHHLISAELVERSVANGTPPIGVQLTADYQPALIARLCEAHCVTPDTVRYAELMQEAPKVRMSLLSGLLRMADILDESRRRASRERARTLCLDLESQSHWWRHYYTSNVEINGDSKTITIWFSFPRDHVDEYQRVIPDLQIPWIEKELMHHREAFNGAGLGWTLRQKQESGPYMDVEQMPDVVMAEMLKQLRRRRIKEEELSRQMVVHSFKEARPVLQRRLDDLKQRKNAMPVDQYVLDLASIAFDLWELGSRRSGWMALAGEFELSYAALDRDRRVEIGTRLLGMLMDDASPELARSWLQRLEADVSELPPTDSLKAPGIRAVAQWYLQMCAYDEAVVAFELAIAATASQGLAAKLSAELLEMHFLQGEFDRCLAGSTQD